MQCLTDLEITYGKTLADPGFHKVLWTDDIVHDLMGGTGRSVYIWSRSGVLEGIREINIFPMNNIPATYKAVNKPLFVKDDISYMLCYSNSDSSLPEITSIKISLDDECIDSYTKITAPLTQYVDSKNETHSTYLWYSTTEIISVVATPRDTVVKPLFEIGEFIECEVEDYYRHSKKEYGTIVNMNTSTITVEIYDLDHTTFRRISVIPNKVSKLASTESFHLSSYSLKKYDLNKSESESVKERLLRIEEQPLPYNNDDIEYLNKDLLIFLNTYFIKEYNSDTQETRNRIAEDMYEILLTTMKIIMKQFNNVKYPTIFAYYLYMILYYEDGYSYSSAQFYKNYNKFKINVCNYNSRDEYYPIIPQNDVSVYYYKILKYFIESKGIEAIIQKFLSIYDNNVGIEGYYSLLKSISKCMSEEIMKDHMNGLYSQLCDLYKEKMMNGSDDNNNSLNSSNGKKKKSKKSFYTEFFNNMYSHFNKLQVDDNLLRKGTLMMIEADIESKVVERMINGFENLNDLNPSSHYKYNNPYYQSSSKNDTSKEDLIKWLEEKKIIDNVFASGVGLNNQLLEKVSYYIQLMFKKNILPSYVIDRIFEFIDSQYNNNNNSDSNNDSGSYDDNAGYTILKNIIDEADEKCLDEFYRRMEQLKDTKLIAEILLLLTKRYYSVYYLKARDIYNGSSNCFDINYYTNRNKYVFDEDMENLKNPVELPENVQQELLDFIKKMDHYNFISYCFDLVVDSNRDYKQSFCVYNILNDFLNKIKRNVRRKVISFLYLKLSSYLNDYNDVEKPNMLFLSEIICSYYSKLSWFENDMKIYTNKLMSQFTWFYVKQKNFFANNEYTDEDKKHYIFIYKTFIESIIIMNNFNIGSCYQFFIDQLKNNMIFEEEEKLIYKSLNDYLKQLNDSNLFTATIELVNKVEFNDDYLEIRYRKEFYEFYISILHIALKRKYTLSLECFKGLILIAIFCDNVAIQNKAKSLFISVAGTRYYTNNNDLCGMLLDYTIRIINSSNNYQIINRALSFLICLLYYVTVLFVAFPKNGSNNLVDELEFLKDFGFSLHIGYENCSYSIVLPSFTVYSLLRKALAMQFNVQDSQIKIRTKEFETNVCGNYVTYNYVDINKRIDFTKNNIFVDISGGFKQDVQFLEDKKAILGQFLHSYSQLEVVLNKCLSCSDNEIAITAFHILEKYYLNTSISNDNQFNDGWEKDFDPKYPMKFYYSLRKLKIAQKKYKFNNRVDDDDDEYGVEYNSDRETFSDCSTDSDNYGNNYNNLRKSNSKKRQNECGPYDQFIDLGGLRMLFSFITEFDLVNFENKQQCITYIEVCKCLFEEQQLVRSEFPIGILISTLFNHIIALYNILPKHIDTDELNRLHEIQVRKKKRDSKYSTLYNSDDEDNNNSNRQINGNCNDYQVQALLDIYDRIHNLYQSNSIIIPDDVFKQIIYLGILSIANYEIRTNSYKLLKLVSQHEPRRIYEVCLPLFQPENIKELYYHADSVETFVEMINDCHEFYDDNFISRIIQCLNDHPVLEMDENDEDTILHMYLTVLLNYFNDHQGSEEIKSQLFDLLLNGVLFDNNSTKPSSLSSSSSSSTSSVNVVNLPKCKGKGSVTVGMNLLQTLCKNSPTRIKVICDIMSKRISKMGGNDSDDNDDNSITDVSDNNNQNKKKVKNNSNYYYTYYNRYQTKSATGYVGLKNRCCLCYMNSSLQQFYMIPKFRKAILSINLPIPEDPEHDLIYQLQKMFSYLQDSEEVDYDTFQLIKALKNSDGSDINPAEQQDSNEFVSSFLQQLENKLSGTNYEKILDELFGGTLAGELKANSVTNPDKVLHSIHTDPYLFLSLDVYKIDDIQHSLETFISGDQVEYKWEETSESLDTTKRTSIKSLPPCLIISLKRFRFDYETLQNIKVNSRFEFPLELNMKNYTLEGRVDSPIIDENDKDTKNRTEDYYHYKLHGVVVHAGTANYGHYYSYINNRFNDNWYEFNDSFVGTFDVHSLEHECFGGEETYGSYYNHTVEKSRNAFILFYDRVDEYNQSNDSISSTDLDPMFCGGSLAERRIHLEKEKRLQQLQKFPIPAHFVKEIEENNRIVLSNRSSNQAIDESSYIDNIANLVKDIMNNRDVNTYDKSVFDSITDLAVSVIFNEKQQKSDSLWYNILNYAIEKNKDGTYNKLYNKFLYLTVNIKDMDSISDIRISDLLYDLLKHFYEQEDVVNNTIPVDTPDLCTVQGNEMTKQPPICNSKVLNISHNLFKYINCNYKSSEKNEVICILLNKICSISYKLVKYFIECRLFDVLLNHICNGKTNLKDITEHFVDRDKEDEKKGGYYSTSTLSSEEMELFYSLFERLKYNYKLKCSETRTDYVAIKFSKEADDSLKSCDFLLGLLNNFEDNKRDIIKKIINQMYQNYDDDFIRLFSEFVEKMDDNKCDSEEATYFTYYLLTRGKENPETLIKDFERIVTPWIDKIAKQKSYNAFNHFLGICRVCQRCPSIHKILLKNIQNNPSNYEIKSSYPNSSDVDFKKLLYGVDNYNHYGSDKYLKTIFDPYNSYGEYVPLPRLKIDYFEPEKCIGVVYSSKTGKKKIIKYDAKKNKFIVQGGYSSNETFDSYYFEKFE